MLVIEGTTKPFDEVILTSTKCIIQSSLYLHMDPAAAIECCVTCYARILHMHGYFYAGEKFTKLVSYA